MTLLGWLLSVSLCSPLPATRPCTCMSGPSLTTRRAARESLATFDAVFDGRVVRLTTVQDSAVMSGRGAFFRWREQYVTSVVSRRWKGAPTDTVTVHTPAD
jgi:hypothetical protein